MKRPAAAPPRKRPANGETFGQQLGDGGGAKQAKPAKGEDDKRSYWPRPVYSKGTSSIRSKKPDGKEYQVLQVGSRYQKDQVRTCLGAPSTVEIGVVPFDRYFIGPSLNCYSFGLL